jgi:fructokinase
LEKTIDIICAGEILIDCIGQQTNATLAETTSYARFLGGSPTNVAINAAKLGLRSALVASCGTDGLGDFMIESLQKANVITTQLSQKEEVSTSIILVSKSTGTPDFIPYRTADFLIERDQIPTAFLQQAKIFHTTCFGLSENPAQTTIIQSAQLATQLGVKTSIDLNFSERIWPDLEEAKKIIALYMATQPLLKISEDDCYRYFGETKSESFILDYFHELGAATICLTKGKEGVILSDTSYGKIVQPALSITDIKDATGAGDAFWTGFLYGQLQQKSFEEALLIAQKLAILKLQHLGGLPNDVDIVSYLDT